MGAQPNSYKVLGMNFNKVNQALVVFFSILFLGFLYSQHIQEPELIILIICILLMDYIWYLFTDIKFNAAEFVIERFLYSKKIPTSDFVRIRRIFFNFYRIEFLKKKFIFLGDVGSIFDSNYESKLISEINSISNNGKT